MGKTQNRMHADRWTGESCNLIVLGRMYPASVIGRLKEQATIAAFNIAVPPVEYAWPTVDRIMNGDKTFRYS